MLGLRAALTRAAVKFPPYWWSPSQLRTNAYWGIMGAMAAPVCSARGAWR